MILHLAYMILRLVLIIVFFRAVKYLIGQFRRYRRLRR